MRGVTGHLTFPSSMLCSARGLPGVLNDKRGHSGRRFPFGLPATSSFASKSTVGIKPTNGINCTDYGASPAREMFDKVYKSEID